MYKTKLQLEWKGYYSYNAENLDKVPSDAGVYKISVKLKNERLKPFYVGQANDLKDRLSDHLQDYEPNDCVKKHVRDYICHFKYALVSRQSDRDGAERALYQHYKPECNDPDAIPSGPDLEINTD